jgi:hypothetical protein
MRSEIERYSCVDRIVSRRVFNRSVVLAAAANLFAAKLIFGDGTSPRAADSNDGFVVVNGWVLRSDDLPESARVSRVI